MGYRSEIDGLRAIAVLAVILAHSGLGVVTGGFAGVDVFFVISGFLITRILIDDLDAGRFSYRRFYARRARRILPALFAVLAVTAPLAFAAMTPSEFEDYALSLAATVVFLSNAYFWDLTGYFSPSALELPLLHTWSLAVEEQFYLLYPPLLYLGWRLGRARGAALTVAVLAFGSLLLSEWGWRNEPEVNYFFTFSRFWELLLGALAAFAERRWPTKGSDALAGLGAAMVAYGLLFYDETTPFPSVYALVPVAGAALILRHAQQGTIVARALSLPPLVGVGLVSYSAYLWHQPVFAFARLQDVTVSAPPLAAALIALTLFLAWASWRFVEEPWRRPRASSAIAARPGRALAAGLATAAVLLGFGLGGYAGDLALWRFGPADRPLVEVSRKEARSYLRELTREFEGREFSEDGRTKVLIVGDSYGKDIVNAMEAVGNGGLDLTFHEIPGPCGNLFLRPEDGAFPPHDLPPKCDGHPRYAAPALLARLAAADLVILASAWEGWQVEFLPASLANVRRATDAQIVLFGTKSFGDVDLRRLLEAAPADRPRLRQPPDDETLGINAAMRALAIPEFVDLLALICEGGMACPPVAEDGRLNSVDGWHLTEAGADLLGRLLIERSPIFAEILG